ncbi:MULTISPECIES: MerR family transcriptional regulator [Actinoalloteichus]|uniref:DNA-binding transcriptional regulator, MerR family n=1 Tax=Actinoalloteichus caeruleus DSM 43889 TaxID=1120930 RepID=A0ABT1JDN7_ACTCY|nr:MerR family transcriptional regulator [Actinoalloteichus caeruleus]MCP2330241.1 DNA-binding transcriptional regulator, MerR family [Actinoalloteichus caeruleus DSM 43889]
MVSAVDQRDWLRIGELARRTATSTRSLRYYEQRGLIVSDREHNGYRRYAPDVVPVVNNIRRLLNAGLSIDDIKQFGSCVRSPSLDATPCAPALEVYEQRLKILRTRIDTLQHLHAALAEQTEHLRAQLPS